MLLQTRCAPALLLALAACGGTGDLPEVSLLPVDPTTVDDLILVVEGDSDDLEIEWLRDDQIVSELDGAFEVQASATTKGETWRVRVAAKGSNETASAEVAIENAPPSIGRVVIGPEAPLRSDSVTATIDGVVDPDGDEVLLRYSWLVDDIEVSSDEVLSPATYKRDSRIQLVLTPSDSQDEGTARSSKGLIGGNNPPYIRTVNIRPYSVYTGSVAWADVELIDHDGDVTGTFYSWAVNGADVGSGGSLDGATHFQRDDVVTVAVMSSDDELDSDWVVSANETVLNSPPSAPGLASTPETPSPGDKIVCTIGTASTDSDGDGVTYIFSWLLNGEPMTNTATTTWSGDTANAGSWAQDDVLFCLASAHDGIEAGAVTYLGF